MLDLPQQQQQKNNMIIIIPDWLTPAQRNYPRQFAWYIGYRWVCVHCTCMSAYPMWVNGAGVFGSISVVQYAVVDCIVQYAVAV